MGKTIRKSRKGYKPQVYLENERDNKSIKQYTYGRRLKPYAKERGKYGVDNSSGDHNPGSTGKLGVSKMSKLITKNANRSKKKYVRQEAKKSIRKFLNK